MNKLITSWQIYESDVSLQAYIYILYNNAGADPEVIYEGGGYNIIKSRGGGWPVHSV